MKKAILFLLVLVLTLNLCACSTKPANSGLPETKTPEKTVSMDGFIGGWKFEDEDQYLFIYKDKTWECRDEEMFLISEGSCSIRDDSLVLKEEDNSIAYTLKKDGSRWLTDNDGRTLVRSEWDEPEDTDGDFTPYIGMWKYDDMDLRLEINEDGTWTMYDYENGDVISGFCYMQEGGLVLDSEGNELQGGMRLGEDGLLYDPMGDPLYPYNESDDPDDHPVGKDDNTPWFVDHDLFVNYEYEDPNYNVVSAVSVRGKDSQSYTRIPAQWYVEQNSYQSTGDGNCIITLTATALTDGSTMPYFVYEEGYTLTFSWNLCDYYSGLILTEDEEDTFYSYNYQSNGENIHVEFSYSCDVTKYKDLSYLFELTLTVRMPEHYDGLVLVCYNAPESNEIKQEHDLIYEGQIVMPVDELPGWKEMQTGIICRINN